MLEIVDDIYSEYWQLFEIGEIITVVLFSLEYVLRVWSIVEDSRYTHPVVGRIRYMFSFMAVIDLLAILPFYLPRLITFDFRFLRGFRLIRLFRVLKLGQYAPPLKTISTVFQKKKYDIGVALFIILLLLLVSSSLMYFIEHEVQPKAFPSIPAALWWGIATLTTIGYGDIVPVTIAGKILSAIISILGIGVFALPSGIIVTGLIEELRQESENSKPFAYCPHCGEKLK